MKRATGLYDRISEYGNLCSAFCKAARGKQAKKEIIDFRKNLSDNLRYLQQQLKTGRFDIGHYYFFSIRDPKPRRICAASFPERVLHHAVMNICEPNLESYAVSVSFACRKGKGLHRAVKTAQKMIRIYPWYLKLDIRKYFDSIDHDILLSMLNRRFKERRLLDLLEAVLRTYHTAPGKGMPVGNLISQHLANFYLGRLDHWIKETCRVKGYLRYMDDFLIFGHTRNDLKMLLADIQVFLDRQLCLRLKDNIQLNQCGRGIPFLGSGFFRTRCGLARRPGGGLRGNSNGMKKMWCVATGRKIRLSLTWSH